MRPGNERGGDAPVAESAGDASLPVLGRKPAGELEFSSDEGVAATTGQLRRSSFPIVISGLAFGNYRTFSKLIFFFLNRTQCFSKLHCLIQRPATREKFRGGVQPRTTK